ncbi:MAG: PIN domain-containing protein, partial [Promethearchaeota archaeon]
DVILLEKIYEIAWGQDRFFEIIQLDTENYKDIYDILKKYCTSKRLLSFVDASLIYIYQKHKADHILSFDRHFDNILNRYF